MQLTPGLKTSLGARAVLCALLVAIKASTLMVALLVMSRVR